MLIAKVMMVVTFLSGEVWQEPVDEAQCAHVAKIHASSPWLIGGNAKISGQVASVECRSLISYRNLAKDEPR